MHLNFLGTGGSWPTPVRNVSGVALRVGREVILFDCGEGTQRQFMKSNLSFMRISKILISHFHGDHFLGIPGLIQSMFLNNRKKKLNIYGPEGTTNLIKMLLSLGYFSSTFEIVVTDLNDSDIVKLKNYDIKARQVDHNEIPALAFCIEEHEKQGKFNLKKAKKLGIPEGPMYRKLQNGESIEINGKKITPNMVLGKQRKGKKIVYSGDTRPCEAIIELAKGCDVLIHDSTLSSDLEEKAHIYGHSTAEQAARIAKLAEVKKLFLMHISPRYKDGENLEQEAKIIFENSIVAQDFLEYYIG